MNTQRPNFLIVMTDQMAAPLLPPERDPLPLLLPMKRDQIWSSTCIVPTRWCKLL